MGRTPILPSAKSSTTSTVSFRGVDGRGAGDLVAAHQIFNLMRAEAHANETRRKRSTQGSRNFLEHALICDGFAAPLGAHGLCPTLFALFYGHLFRLSLR